MSTPKGRYADLPVRMVPDASGRLVPVLPPAPRGRETLQGYYPRRDREQLDHLAHVFLDDASAFHRICDLNGAILPDALAEASEVAIPRKLR